MGNIYSLPYTPAWTQCDPRWHATIHLLDAPLLRTKGCRRFVDFESADIDFAGLIDKASRWSTGEILMVRAAWDLFDGDGEATLGDLLRHLDDHALFHVIRALWMFHAGSERTRRSVQPASSGIHA